MCCCAIYRLPSARAATSIRRPQKVVTRYYPSPQGPRALLRRVGAADPAGGRKGPLRIKKIAERRTIWGGGRLRRKRGAEDHGDGREQPQERGARRLDRLHLPGGAGAQQRRPGLGHGRHPDRRTAPRKARAAAILTPPARPGPDRTALSLTPPAQAFAGPAEDHWINVVTSRAGGAFAEVPPGRAARERGRPALCANVLYEFVRAPLPRSTSRRAGRPVGSTPLRVRTVFFKAVMFLLH